MVKSQGESLPSLMGWLFISRLPDAGISMIGVHGSHPAVEVRPDATPELHGQVLNPHDCAELASEVAEFTGSTVIIEHLGCRLTPRLGGVILCRAIKLTAAP